MSQTLQSWSDDITPTAGHVRHSLCHWRWRQAQEAVREPRSPPARRSGPLRTSDTWCYCGRLKIRHGYNGWGGSQPAALALGTKDLAFAASVAGAGLCFMEWGGPQTQEMDRWSQARVDGLPDNDQPDAWLLVGEAFSVTIRILLALSRPERTKCQQREIKPPNRVFPLPATNPEFPASTEGIQSQSHEEAGWKWRYLLMAKVAPKLYPQILGSRGGSRRQSNPFLGKEICWQYIYRAPGSAFHPLQEFSMFIWSHFIVSKFYRFENNFMPIQSSALRKKIISSVVIIDLYIWNIRGWFC